MLNGIRVEFKDELIHHIYKYFEEINEIPVSYKWTYKMDDIDLSKKNISSIVYEVVNAKTTLPEDTDKRASKPIHRKSCKQPEHK